MSTYKHGVYASEEPTGIQTPRNVSAGIPFVVGTAPGNQTDTNNINTPVLCYTRDEAVAAVGYAEPELNETSGLKEYKYSLCEFIDSHFRLYGAAPVILVNVGNNDVKAENIIGGTDTDGKKTGLELIDEVFPRFRVVPGLIICPGFSEIPEVAAVMAAKAENINGMFKAVALIDVPTTTVKKYSDVAKWKTDNNITDPNQIVCFPMLSLDGVLYHQSTQLAGLMCQVDADNDDVPYVSPSNKNYQMTAAVLKDGTAVYLGLPEANTLNGAGVVTALNWVGGWKCWAVNTACYPDSTDVKDYLITNRRMFAWVNNNLILKHWARLDNPLRRRQIDGVVTDANQWFNSLMAAEQIAGGRVEFTEVDNPETSLMEGISNFDTHFTPFAQNKEINFKIHYDASYLSGLFS
ncbi:MAG: phage tail sheath family protein [Lentisphaeria bacterium]|nr:phage tail sheath family protein [Lentisphaeria bacterium]